MTDDDKTLTMVNALQLLDEAKGAIEHLDGSPLNVGKSNDKNLTRDRAKRSRDLLYAAHLADAARLEILNQYHKFKGETPPTVQA